MKSFNRILCVVGGAGLIAVTGVAYWKMGWQGVAVAVAAAAGASTIWSACMPEETEGAKLQVTIRNGTECRTSFNDNIEGILAKSPTAVAAICIGVENVTRKENAREFALEQARKILDGESEFVKIEDAKAI